MVLPPDDAQRSLRREPQAPHVGRENASIFADRWDTAQLRYGGKGRKRVRRRQRSGPDRLTSSAAAQKQQAVVFVSGSALRTN